MNAAIVGWTFGVGSAVINVVHVGQAVQLLMLSMWGGQCSY